MRADRPPRAARTGLRGPERQIIALALALVALVAAAALPALPAAAAATGEAHCRKSGASCPGLVYQGLTYPYLREEGSYLFVDGGIYPYLVATTDLLGDSTVALPDGSSLTVAALLDELGIDAGTDQPLVPIAGYGSNPAPSQIARKYRDEIAKGGFVMPVMKGEIEGYDVVWTPFFTAYGAIPSTIFPVPGTTVDIWINWMRQSDVERMDATEHVGGNWYTRVAIEGATYRFEGPQPARLDVYVSCHGAMKIGGEIAAVASVPAAGRRLTPYGEVDVLRAVLPRVGADDIVGLVRATVSDEAARAANSASIAGLGTFAPGSGPFARGGCEGGAAAETAK